MGVEEDLLHEFKTVRGNRPVESISSNVAEYVVGFLNSEGGRIFWGVSDGAGLVVGVALEERQKDELNRKIAGHLCDVTPPVSPDLFTWEYRPVERAEGLFVLELVVPKGGLGQVYYTGRGEVFHRQRGVNQKLKGPQLTEFIRSRTGLGRNQRSFESDPHMLALASRVRRVFIEHGLEPAQIPRFLEMREAPFSITLQDLRNDEAFLDWLDETKINWVRKTFLIRREWIDGEDEAIHQNFIFDKLPVHFFETVKSLAQKLMPDDLVGPRFAYFLRNGVGREWGNNGQNRIYVVLAIPIAQVSNERVIYTYITDGNPYPWDGGRCLIQNRTWLRLLTEELQFFCVGREIPKATGDEIWNNRIFLRDVTENQLQRPRDGWDPDDYCYYEDESVQAKETEFMPEVEKYLRVNGLPFRRGRNLGRD